MLQSDLSFKQENFQKQASDKEVLFGGPVKPETGIVLHENLGENSNSTRLGWNSIDPKGIQKPVDSGHR